MRKLKQEQHQYSSGLKDGMRVGGHRSRAVPDETGQLFLRLLLSCLDDSDVPRRIP